MQIAVFLAVSPQHIKNFMVQRFSGANELEGSGNSSANLDVSTKREGIHSSFAISRNSDSSDDFICSAPD